MPHSHTLKHGGVVQALRRLQHPGDSVDILTPSQTRVQTVRSTACRVLGRGRWTSRKVAPDRLRVWRLPVDDGY